MTRDVFHHHDGVIHHEPGRDGKRHQRKVVEAVAEQIHHGEGADQRHGNGNARNQSGARVAQKNEDHQNDQGHRDQQRRSTSLTEARIVVVRSRTMVVSMPCGIEAFRNGNWLRMLSTV